jgi:hypothetical protein
VTIAAEIGFDVAEERFGVEIVEQFRRRVVGEIAGGRRVGAAGIPRGVGNPQALGVT